VHVVKANASDEILLMPELVVPASIYCEEYNVTKRRPTRSDSLRIRGRALYVSFKNVPQPFF
jgi:hypothetical protein